MTEPMKYDTDTRTFSFYSEDTNLLGDHEFTISAFLTEYPVIETPPQAEKEILTVINPCPDPDDVTKTD